MTTFTAKDLNLQVDNRDLKAFFKTSSRRHAIAMVIDWAVIAAAIYLGIRFWNPLVYFLAVLVIGARQHALAILMHDATHFRFLKNRKMNDAITNFFTMYPLFTSIEKYRHNHLAHHNHLNTDHDPDWVAKLTKREFEFPKTKQAFMWTLVTYMTLYQGFLDAAWFFKRFGPGKKKKGQGDENKPLKTVFFIVLIAGLTLVGGWKYYLLFWVIPYLTSFFMFQYIRSVAEHYGELSYDNLLTSTRTVKTNWIERFLIAPHNVGYHLEHHLYPGVPFYHLPKLHQTLMTDDFYNKEAHVTQGYMSGLMEELGKINA